MSKISKLLCVLLALVMIVGLFAGCVQEQKPTEPQKTEPQGTQGSNPPTTTEGKKIEWPLEEPIVFEMMVNGSKDFNNLILQCDWYKELVEKTNVRIKVIPMGSEALTTLNGMLQAGTEGDFMLGGYSALSDARIVELAENGFLMPIEDYINETIMPNYCERALEAMPAALQKMVAPDGHIYSFARVLGNGSSNWESPLMYNAKWLKQVPGFENGNTPKNVEEMTKVLKYYRDNDMNGNGDKTDEIPFLLVCSSAYGDNQASLQGLMNLWGLPTKDGTAEMYAVVRDGKVALAPTFEEYKACLKVVNEWYEEGLLWDEFFSAPDKATMNGFANGATDVWGFYNGSQFNNIEGKAESKPWWYDIEFMEPFDTGYDCVYFMNPGITGYKNVFTVFSSCEEPEILLHWFDEFHSLYGSWAASHTPATYKLKDGTEIKNWEYKDGKIIDITDELKVALGRLPTKEESDYVSATYPSWSTLFGAVMYTFNAKEAVDGIWPTETPSKVSIYQEYQDENPELFNTEIWPRPYYTADQAEICSDSWTAIKALCTKYETAFIKGEMDIDAKWQDYQDELADAGLEDLVEVLQEAWDASAGK